MVDTTLAIAWWQWGLGILGTTLFFFYLAGVNLIQYAWEMARGKEEEKHITGMEYEEVNRLEPSLVLTKMGTFECVAARTVSADPNGDTIKGEIKLHDGTILRATNHQLRVQNPFEAIKNKGGRSVWIYGGESREEELHEKYRRERMRNAALNEEAEDMHKEFTQVGKRIAESSSSMKKAMYGSVGAATAGGLGSPWYSNPYYGGLYRRYGYGGGYGGAAMMGGESEGSEGMESEG